MEIFTKSGIYIANIDKILTCDIEERLDGVLKMNFETLITDELLNLVSGNEYMVLYNTDYYDVVSIQKSLNLYVCTNRYEDETYIASYCFHVVDSEYVSDGFSYCFLQDKA